MKKTCFVMGLFFLVISFQLAAQSSEVPKNLIACAKELFNFQTKYSFIAEIFVMDTIGGNVGQTGKTSDYDQADEGKFQQTFGKGSGAVHYGDVEHDDSVDEIIIQISVTVSDTRGRPIGAITFGISLDRWERR